MVVLSVVDPMLLSVEVVVVFMVVTVFVLGENSAFSWCGLHKC